MMRSLYSGVSGLRTHQTKMDVIGNNIANVNTTAYKSQSVTFRDLMYQTTQSASGANAELGTGGINAKQIGLGVTTGAINTNIGGQGSAQTTNNAFDIMISGDAFFVVSNGSQNYFTRDGSFYVDGQGNLAMTSTGYTVMGWQVDPETGEPKADTVSALRIMDDANMTYPAEATSQARVTGIVDKNDTQVNSTSGRVMNLEFYDNLGYAYTAKFSIHGTTTDGSYYIALDDIKDATGASIGTDMMNAVSFGDTLEVDTAIPYTLRNGTFGYSAKINFKNGDATVGGSYAINTDLAVGTGIAATDLKAIYGLTDDEVTAFAGLTVKIDDNGKLTVVSPPVGVKSSYVPQNGITSTLTDEKLSVTPAGATTPVELIPGTYAPGATGAPTNEQLLNLYGLDVDAEMVKEFTVNSDGSITVTKKDVNNAARLEYNTSNGNFLSVAGNGEGMITLGLNGVHQKFSDIVIDFSTSTNVNNNGSSTVGASKGTQSGLGAGRKIGDMNSIAVEQDGTITASYDNGMSRILGQISTATFANPSGLEKQGDNLYTTTANSGEFDGIGQDITADGTGKMQSGVLEMSNVDLSQEFTEMITTQRGFQANSRIITVSDTLLEELTNLKR